ncbi:MAG: porin [Verrucomicrobium sp.]|nr:porin [Verrucomicrobium sp.]
MKEYKITRFYILIGLFCLTASLGRAEDDAAADPTAATSSSSSVDDLRRQLQDLQNKVIDLQSRQEVQQEQLHNAGLTNLPTVRVSSQGFELQSADKQFDLRLRGLMQVDAREFLSPGNSGGAPGDGIYVRRLRPIFQGTLWGAYEFVLEPDFGSRSGGAGGTSGSTAVLANAYINIHYNDTVQLMAGRWKGPVGFERAEPSRDTIWIENGLPQNLTPNYYQAIAVHGDIKKGVFSYSVGVGEGVRDNANADVQTLIDNNYDFIAALGCAPFAQSENKALKGLGFGVGGTVGERGDAATAANAPLATYVTPGQTVLLNYNTAASSGQTVVESEDGEAWRLAPYIYYYYGPLGFYGEYGVSSVEARRAVSGTGTGTGVRHANFENRAWQAVLSYVLTGEDAGYRGVVPFHPFSPKEHSWGAFQVMARYGELYFDDAYFASSGAATGVGGAFVGSGPHDVRDIGLGLNWYLNENIKAQFDYDYISYSGGNMPVTKATEDENAFITQLQLAF